MTDENRKAFLLICQDCGNPFFTEGEKNFYEQRGLVIPRRCKKCREIVRCKLLVKESYSSLNEITKNLYDEILQNWSVEAKKENPAYFYNVKEVDWITRGQKSFVIGRKGSGKTAIAKHLYEADQFGKFSIRLSFKNFPFNVLYSLDNKEDYTAPNQYISIWKYIIYSYVCKEMIKNENIDEDIRLKLSKLYGNSEEEPTKRLMERWTCKEFGAKLFGIGFTVKGDNLKGKESWIDTIEILQQLIMDYCDKAKYFIVFDELDEDYKDFASTEEERKYMCMITSLFKAVQDIRSTFDSTKKFIYPVVFLRSDIFIRLKDSDKNKWREDVIELEWDRVQIKNMLSHRLSVALNIDEVGFEEVWLKVFDASKVKMGHRQMRDMEIFEYIERSTEMRPRDFVKYVIECVQIANSRNEIPITPQTVREADDHFSEYLKGETIDELFAVLPEIDEILGLLSTIRKQSFGYEIFEKEYNRLVSRGVVPKRDIRQILLNLFDAGVIGNKPTMRGQTIFRFSKKAPRFNFNETMVVHRGLYKALQIF